MEIALALAAALIVGLALGRLGRRGRRRRARVEELGGFLAGAAPAIRSSSDQALDLEEGALDPDELDGEPAFWDEGADDELS